ncbi:cupredoxin domain-containing protein [Candidatus Daviesbacteria bacterium]|nr:cupredoxin domain-containing protein [Candidatus Daviesbacteria bacterium]
MMRFLLIVLIAAAVYLPQPVFAHSQVQVIEMTPGGFEPNSVTIDANSAVIFKNSDTNPRWPASNVHPTHGIYPEFDPKMQIEPGKDWTFKPKKIGTFKFHDHLFPHFRGTLIVEAEPGSDLSKTSNPVSTLIDNLKNSLSLLLAKITSLFNTKAEKVVQIPDLNKLPSDLQFKSLEDYAKEAGAEKAWGLVISSFKGQAGSSGNIHDLAHLAGSLLFKQNGFPSITACTTQFAFGCYHGFLDTAFSQNLDNLTVAYDACQKLGPENSGPVSSCLHGIGHGVASYYSTTDLKSSLSECRKLVSGREYCFDGVFMEFVRNAPETFYKKNDPLYPCNDLEKNFGPIYSFSCGRNQPSLMMGRFKMGFDEVASICENAASKLIKQGCIDSLGFSLAGSGETEQIIQSCKKIKELEFELKCAQAAAGELIFQEVPGWEEKSEAVCSAFPEGLNECKSRLDRLIKEYGRVKKITFNIIKDGEDPDNYIRRELNKCYQQGGRDGCYKEAAKVFYSGLGLAKTLALLKTNEGYPEVYARCHEVTHYLSRSEYEKQKNIAKVYAQCDSTCHGGCYHGTMEAYLNEQLNSKVNLTTHFPTVCGKAEDYQKPLEFNECLHGMGHAAMFTTDMELKESLKLCDTLGNQDPKERCYSGVFMENSSSSTSNDHKSKYLKTGDPFYPCNALEESYQALCWQYQSSYFALIENQDFTKVANLCLQIPAVYQDRCFKTIGTNQVGFTSSQEIMRDNCNKMPSEHIKDVCVSGVISSMAYRFVGDLDKMVSFCSLVSGNNKESCYKQIGTSLLDWSTDRNLAEKNCNKIPNSEGSSWCLSVL